MVRIVVVTYGPSSSLNPCLRSLRNALHVPYEVVLVDNGAVGGTPRRAADERRVTLIETGRNLGYGTAANLGARGSQAPWLLVINPDTEFSAGSLDRLLDAAVRWPRAGVLGPVLLTPDGARYPSARALPSLGNGIGHALLGWCWPANPWSTSYRRDGHEPVEGVTGWLSGACMLFRREAFETVGGFDEGYFMYFEDLDVCERVAKAGWECVYIPSAEVRHVGGESTAQVQVSMSRAHHRSALRYLSGRYPAWWHAPLRLAFRLGLRARFLLASRKLPADQHALQPPPTADAVRRWLPSPTASSPDRAR